MLVKKIGADKYLKRFVEYCKKKFGGNLGAIIIYGSYSLGYFDDKKSDYDIFILFKKEIPKGKRTLKRKFPKISVNYFMTFEDVMKKSHLGHFATYITLLKSRGVIYCIPEYKKLLRRLKKLNLFEKMIDLTVIEAKSIYEINHLKKVSKYNALKWALPSIRKRLQFLSFIRFNKLIWNLRKNLRKNKDVLDKDEIEFILGLHRQILNRKPYFSSKDKIRSIGLIEKIDKEIIFHLRDLI